MSKTERYLGNSTTAHLEDKVVYLTHEQSDGKEFRIRMDPLVLDEFLAWLEDNEMPEFRATRADAS